MELPKWIINDGELVMGVVEFHKNLLKDHKNKTIGGGLYHMDAARKKLYLYSKSQDFGQCLVDDIYALMETALFRPSLDGYSLYFSGRESLKDALTEDNNEFIGVITF